MKLRKRLMMRTLVVGALAGDPAKFYGRQATISGVTGSARLSEKYMGYKKPKVQVITFDLYEPSNDPKYPRGKRYISVTLPADSFSRMPSENTPLSVTGALKPYDKLGSIGDD